MINYILFFVTWPPQGKRKRNRPLGTWRRTIVEELKKESRERHCLRYLDLLGTGLAGEPLLMSRAPLRVQRNDDGCSFKN